MPRPSVIIGLFGATRAACVYLATASAYFWSFIDCSADVRTLARPWAFTPVARLLISSGSVGTAGPAPASAGARTGPGAGTGAGAGAPGRGLAGPTPAGDLGVTPPGAGC